MAVSIEDKDRVIVRRFSGAVSLEDIIDSWNKIFLKYDDLTIYRGIVSDLMDVNLQFGEEHHNYLVEYLMGFIDRIEDMKVAIVMDTPLITNAILMNRKMTQLQIRPFSTMDAAMKWISY